MQSRNAERIALPAAGALAVLGAWQLLVSMNITNPLYLPTPQATAAVAKVTLVEPSYWCDVAVTLGRAAVGFTLAGVIGLPIGLLLGVLHRTYLFFSVPVDFMRSIPTAALLPLFLVVFGLGNTAKIAVVLFGCIFVFLIGALYGARGGPETIARKHAVQTMGGGRFAQFKLVVVPEALLGVATSLRLAASLSIVLAVFTEMFLGADDGVGRRLIDAYLAFRVPLMYVYIVTLGIVGIIVNKFLEAIEMKYIAARR